VLCELYSASFVVHHIWLTYGPSHLASGSITDYYLCYLMDYSCSWRLDCLEFSVIIAFCCLVVVDTVIHRRCIIVMVNKCCEFGSAVAAAMRLTAVLESELRFIRFHKITTCVTNGYGSILVRLSCLRNIHRSVLCNSLTVTLLKSVTTAIQDVESLPAQN